MYAIPHSFRKIFPDTDEGSFSKRSLTSLTKIALSASGPHTDIPIWDNFQDHNSGIAPVVYLRLTWGYTTRSN